ncbi:MAG: ABC transporter substrate binding protein, partial [Clostridia bacterium]
QIHSVNKETKSLRKPIVWGELAPHKESGIATYGIDYKELGKISAQMAFDILIKGAKPSDMPIRTMDKYVFNINEKVATEIGYAIPESIKALAK